MGKYYVFYNNATNIDYDLYVVTRPSKPTPRMQYEEKKVSGGKTIYIEKGYDDIPIPVSFNFNSKKPSEWDKDYRNIKSWLLGKVNKKLKFSDDLEVFYKVNKVEINTPERVVKTIGRFTATFTCDPYTYIEDEEMELPNILYNNYEISQPNYRIVGNGELIIKINGKDIKVNVGQEVLIDTERGLTFREGDRNNVSLTGLYKDLYLQKGENTFEYTGDFKVYITPNRRCL